MQRWVGLSVVLILLHSASSTTDEQNLGYVDRTLLLKLLNLALQGPTTAASELYINSTGLYLLPETIQISGRVNSVCAFGYVNDQFAHLIQVPNTTQIDLTTSVRLFVYIVLLRKLPSDPTKYFVVYPPVVLHHDLSEGCLDVADEFNWHTEPGDRIGAFIPSDCVDVKDLSDDIITAKVKQFSMLCPSQPNLVTNPEYSVFSTFLSNSSLLDVADINDNIMIGEEDFQNMSLLLNMNATIVRTTTTTATTITVGSFNRVSVVAISTALGAAVFLGLLMIILMLVYLIWRKNTVRRKQKDKVYYENTQESSPVKSTQDQMDLNEGAYENDKYVNCGDKVINNLYGGLQSVKDYDYDEVYFEPASEEEELFAQLETLSLPIVKDHEIKLHEMLGNGEFGTVYHGLWVHPVDSASVSEEKQTIEEEVAVKCIDESSSEENRVKFLQEAAIMAQFNHPNILRILGIATGEKLKIVVNLMKDDLRKHLLFLRPKKLNAVSAELGPTLLSYSRQIAFGMLYLSNKSYVHRDLAARNILVSSDGTSCKIADFGLSRDLQNQSHYVSHGGKIPVKWTAPEAINYRKYSTASDVWSYGCVLYEIWSLGYKPFHEYSNEEAIKLLKTGYRLPPPPGCPRAIYEVMTACWHPDEKRRTTFINIVVALQKPDFQILRKPPAAQASNEPGWILGASLETSENLYQDLQNLYKKKQRRTFGKLSSRYRSKTKERKLKSEAANASTRTNTDVTLHGIEEKLHSEHEYSNE